MQKEFFRNNSPESDFWDDMWTTRTIEQELETCELESPSRDLFLAYLSKKGKILDGGCGFGKWVIYLKRLGYDIVGIDNSELAITTLKGFESSLQVEVGDILDIHYPDSSFDAYISMGVVEHFENGPLPAFKEAYRVLKPNGLIFVLVPTVNILRGLIRRPLRKVINAFPGAFMLLKKGWSTSKQGALLAAMGNILPGDRGRYYHFFEYRYSKSELENFLGQSGFEIIETVPDDFYGSKSHAVGLVVDFPFLGDCNAVNFKLNLIGKLISRICDGVSPWIACSAILCIARVLKENHDSR